MQITIVERGDDIMHVVLAGRLDTTAVEEFAQCFTDAMGDFRE